MAVRIKPQAPTGARLPRELVGGRALDEGEEPAVRLLQVPADRGEREAAALLDHPPLLRTGPRRHDPSRRPMHYHASMPYPGTIEPASVLVVGGTATDCLL